MLAGSQAGESSSLAHEQWPFSDRVVVFCNNDHAGAEVHPRECTRESCEHTDEARCYAMGRLQAGSARFKCRACGIDGVVLDSPPATMGDFTDSMKSDPIQPLWCECPTCGGRQQAMGFVKCGGCVGHAQDGARCRGQTDKGECALLAQAIFAQPDELCDIMFMEPPEGGVFFKFEPCGHKVEAQAFAEALRVTMEGGGGRGSIKPTHGQQGDSHYAFSCPVGDAGAGCADSFVHDIHHFKCAGCDMYQRMKEWAADTYVPPVPVDPEVVAADNSTVIRIQELLTRASAVNCPRCGQAGVKDTACCHIVCSNSGCGASYCYCCGKSRRVAVDGVQCAGHCPMYLTGHVLANGATLSNNPQLAVQEFHMWMAKKGLFE